MSKTKKSKSEKAVKSAEERQDQQNDTAATSPQVQTEASLDANDSKKEKKRKRKDKGDDDDVKLSKKVKKSHGTDGAAIEGSKKDKKSKRREATDDNSEEPATLNVKEPEKQKKKKGKKGGATNDNLEDPTELNGEGPEKKAKKDKKDKRSNKSATETEATEADKLEDSKSSKDKPRVRESTLERDFIGFDGGAVAKFESTFAEREAPPKKPKKKSKKEKLAERADLIESYAMEIEKEMSNSAAEANTKDIAPEGETVEATEVTLPKKKERFIVFVGNLPYSATKESLQRHFAKLEPIDIRMMTEKDTGRTKGYAFVEFDRKDRMATCLKKFHHSLHPDGGKGRRMNIEVTVGGGGQNDGRRSKLETKNEKLQRERQREHERNEDLREKRRIRKEKKERKLKKHAESEVSNGVAPPSSSNEPLSDHGGMHPSRLAMMQKPEPTWKARRGRY